MTHQIAMKVNQSDTAGADFAALADQLIQDSWHLPPGGDQSWREQDAARIFSGHGKDGINDTEDVPSVGESDVPPGAEDSFPEDQPLEPGFKTVGTLGILLPLSLATVIVFFVVLFSVPEILTAGFWNAPEPRAMPVTKPVRTADAAPLAFGPSGKESGPGKLRPSLAESGESSSVPRVPNGIAAPTADHRNGLAILPAKAEIQKTIFQQPGHATAEPTMRARRVSAAVIRLATASSFRQPASRAKRIATRLPPIGSAYFASHKPAVAARKAPAADWKAETTKWDEMAAKIRARRERYQSDGNTALAVSRDQASREFP